MKTDKLFNEIQEILEGIVQFGLIALVLMLLWNWLMPALFTLPGLTYWQACGLRALARCLFANRQSPGTHYKR